MKYRKSIVKTLDLFISESSKNMTEDMKKDKLDAWHIGLDDIDDKRILSGLRKALKQTDGFLMSCGEFRSVCVLDSDNMTIESQAYQAWNLVYKNLNSNRSPCFKDNAIAEAIRSMGGWKKLCSMLIKDEPFVKKEFIAIYSPCKISGKNDYDPYLPGSFGAEQIHFIGFDVQKEKILLNDLSKQIKNGDRDKTKLLKMYGEAKGE